MRRYKLSDPKSDPFVALCKFNKDHDAALADMGAWVEDTLMSQEARVSITLSTTCSTLTISTGMNLIQLERSREPFI